MESEGLFSGPSFLGGILWKQHWITSPRGGVGLTLLPGDLSDSELEDSDGGWPQRWGGDGGGSLPRAPHFSFPASFMAISQGPHSCSDKVLRLGLLTWPLSGSQFLNVKLNWM